MFPFDPPENISKSHTSLISFYTSWKRQENCNFLMFSGNIERDKWHEMGSTSPNFVMIFPMEYTQFYVSSHAEFQDSRSLSVF